MFTYIRTSIVNWHCHHPKNGIRSSYRIAQNFDGRKRWRMQFNPPTFCPPIKGRKLWQIHPFKRFGKKIWQILTLFLMHTPSHEFRLVDGHAYLCICGRINDLWLP